MENASIRDVMNALCRNPGQIEDRRKTPRPDAATRALPDGAEIERFMAIDPLTVTLYKRYVDARAQYLSALGDGRDSSAAMADIAADLADSAWCALESRIHELRENESAQRRARLLKTLEEQDRLRRAEGKTGDKANRVLIDRKRREERERRLQGNFLFLLWLLWLSTRQETRCAGFSGLFLERSRGIG